MKRSLSLLLVAGLLVVTPAVSQAQNLLSNADLNLSHIVGDPFLYYAEPVDWTITTNPCTYDPCAVVSYTVPGVFYTPYSGYVAAFADRSNAPTPPAYTITDVDMNGVHDFQGLIGEAYQGRYPGEIVGTVSVEIKQAVPATAGTTYRMSGWAHFEGGYAGGVEFIDTFSPSARAGLPSETDTFFALEFLDGVGAVLSNSIEWELHDDGGQQNDLTQTPTSRVWVQHVLTAEAPLGTVSVQVRAAMVNGEFNIDIPGGSQNVFFDDFTLTVVPEPATWLLGLSSVALFGLVRRNR